MIADAINAFVEPSILSFTSSSYTATPFTFRNGRHERKGWGGAPNDDPPAASASSESLRPSSKPSDCADGVRPMGWESNAAT